MYSKKIQSVFLFVAVFIATTGLRAYAGDTGIVTGRVFDNDHKPVAGASITLSAPTGSYRTVTDRRGRFRFFGVYVATYTMRIREEGRADLVFLDIDAVPGQMQDIGKVELPNVQPIIIGRTTP
jgi:hypothetical protein